MSLREQRWINLYRNSGLFETKDKGSDVFLYHSINRKCVTEVAN